MDVREVRKRKGEAERAIQGILLRFVEETDTHIIKIELSGAVYGDISRVIMDVKL